MANGFMWFDVNATDDQVGPVIDFYLAVFDGPISPDDSVGAYRSWMSDGDRPWAAVVHADEADPAVGRWVPYVHVRDLDGATQAAVAAGGTVVREATDGPAGRAVTVADPAGALVALWVPFEPGH